MSMDVDMLPLPGDIQSHPIHPTYSTMVLPTSIRNISAGLATDN